MPKFSRGVIRLLAVLALVALVQPVATTLSTAAAGREFSRCIVGCNETRKICDDRCVTECQAMFPGTPNKQQRDACIAACKDICLDISDDCKLECQAIKEPCPEEP